MTWQVRQLDACDFLATMPSASVDAIVTDPPYGELKSEAVQWDKRTYDWLEEAERVLKPGGALWVFGSLKFLLAQHAATGGFRLYQDLIWEKPNGQGLNRHLFKRVHELAWHYVKAGAAPSYAPPLDIGAVRASWTGKGADPRFQGTKRGAGSGGVFRTLRSVQKHSWDNRPSLHPTQKPVPLLVPIVRYSCPRGGLVVDPFAGSGSTGVAAVSIGRDFAGTDLQADYVALARKRIEEAERIFQEDCCGLEYW